jgi:hypothetical protein
MSRSAVQLRQMHRPIPFIRPSMSTAPLAWVTVTSRADVCWNQPDRHSFKAPPLQVLPPLSDVAALAVERRRKLPAF